MEPAHSTYSFQNPLRVIDGPADERSLRLELLLDESARSSIDCVTIAKAVSSRRQESTGAGKMNSQDQACDFVRLIVRLIITALTLNLYFFIICSNNTQLICVNILGLE